MTWKTPLMTRSHPMTMVMPMPEMKGVVMAMNPAMMMRMAQAMAQPLAFLRASVMIASPFSSFEFGIDYISGRRGFVRYGDIA